MSVKTAPAYRARRVLARGSTYVFLGLGAVVMLFPFF